MDLPHLQQNASAAIIDFQCQEGRKNDNQNYKTYIKELAICALNSNDIKCYVFKSLYSKNLLSYKALRHANFIKRKLIGLDWNDGDYNYMDINNILEEFIKKNNITVLYVKGDEKVKYLETANFFNVKVYDLLEFGCPRLDYLPNYDVTCHVNAHVQDKHLRCAARNVYRLIIWLNGEIWSCTPAHSEFSNSDVRLLSFENWPQQMRQSSQELSDAGFFYTGIADKVICFSCGIELDDWNYFDVPLEAHKQHSYDCKYLKSIKNNT